MAIYTIVENAGYEGERDIHSFEGGADAAVKAQRFIKRWYRANEIENLHVAIAKDTFSEATGKSRTYEY